MPRPTKASTIKIISKSGRAKDEAVHLNAEYLIVGAGPAGCALAWQLRQAGCDVLVVERHDAATKDKLCGGALGVSALRMIEALYGRETQQQLALTCSSRLVMRSFNHEIVNDIQYATLPRKRLDDLLLARCMQAGANVRDNTRLVSLDEQSHLATCADRRTGESVHIHYGSLIGADGAASMVRRLLTGRQQRFAVSIAGSAPLASDDIICDYHPAHRGYCWHIPNDSEASVGCMLHGGSAQDCRTWIADFCESLGIDQPNLRGALIPSGDDVLLRAGEDAWLVGDAAGLIRPIDGGGIHYALQSAYLLASSLLGETPYEQAVRPILDAMAEDAEKRESCYIFRSILITQKGHECQPTPTR